MWGKKVKIHKWSGLFLMGCSQIISSNRRKANAWIWVNYYHRELVKYSLILYFSMERHFEEDFSSWVTVVLKLKVITRNKVWKWLVKGDWGWITTCQDLGRSHKNVYWDNHWIKKVVLQWYPVWEDIVIKDKGRVTLAQWSL